MNTWIIDKLNPQFMVSLYWLAQIVKRGLNFSTTARNFSVDEKYLKSLIRQFEKDIGIKLFKLFIKSDESDVIIGLTESGEEVYQLARDLLSIGIRMNDIEKKYKGVDIMIMKTVSSKDLQDEIRDNIFE